MTRLKCFRLKNRMLFANFIANLIGVLITFFLLRSDDLQLPAEITAATIQVDPFFMPLAFCTGFLFTIRYEQPMRRFVNLRYQGLPVPDDLSTKARQRLLNEPFVLIALDFGIWLAAALVYTGAIWRTGAGRDLVLSSILNSLTVGLITITVAFFVFEFLLQRMLVPFYFPEGGLYTMAGTIRIKIRTRLAAMLAAVNLIPFLDTIYLSKRMDDIEIAPAAVVDLFQTRIAANAFIFMGIGIWLTFLVGSNLTRPFSDIIDVLQGVRRGFLDKRIRVTSNDEIGYTGDVINEMTSGLKERERLRRSLDLAMEVQQSLLPQTDPDIHGLDIAGRSVYCDETGGDYFDFMDEGELGKGKIGVAVGDVSGHGIASALLMATARASLRQRLSLQGSIGAVLSDVNRMLTQDVEESGQFMTLFYMAVDMQAGKLEWVRAGHDPAIFYDPAADVFDELKGPGIAMGLDENWTYEGVERGGLARGQIMVIGTDGIWEARNPKGDMFGKHRIYDIIRKNPAVGAKELVDDVIGSLIRFQEHQKPEDDVTLVVVKIEADFDNAETSIDI